MIECLFIPRRLKYWALIRCLSSMRWVINRRWWFVSRDVTLSAYRFLSYLHWKFWFERKNTYENTSNSLFHYSDLNEMSNFFLFSPIRQSWHRCIINSAWTCCIAVSLCDRSSINQCYSWSSSQALRRWRDCK